MSSHHDHDNHPQEVKPVAFRTPLILALVTVLIIFLAVSTCDKKQDCCEGDKCEAACDAKHEAHSEHGTTPAVNTAVEGHEHEVVTEEAAAVTDSIMKADSTHTAAPAKAEEHGHH